MPNLAYTWTTLRAALQAWPQNENATFVANLDAIVGLGERRLVRDLNLEIFDHVTTLSLAADSRIVDRPNDFITTRSLRIGAWVTAPGDSPSQVSLVADSTMSYLGAPLSDDLTINWPEAFAAAEAGAVAMVVLACQSDGVGTYPTITLSLGGVDAAVYHYEQDPVGFGSGNSNLIVALIPIEEATSDQLVINWDPLSLEVDLVVQGAVFAGVDTTALSELAAVVASNVASLGPLDVAAGGAVVVAGAFYTGSDFTPTFVGDDDTDYGMLTDSEAGEPFYISGHEVGFGYRLFADAATETVQMHPIISPDLPFLPGIAFVLPAQSATVSSVGQSYPLEQRSWDYCQEFAPDPTLTGRPRYFNELNSNEWQLVPTADQDYGVIARYVRLPQDSLNSTAPNAASWLSRSVPDALFAACLMEAEHFLKADDRYADYQSKYEKELLPNARAELRNLIRAGDYTPFKPAAQKVG